MQFAIVVHVQDHAALFDDYGLGYCLDALASVLDAGEEAHLLVAAGFELIPAEVVAGYGARGVRIVDVGPLYRAIMDEAPWLASVAAMRPFDQICFLRHLVLERFFAGDPVLASDADVVWKLSPGRMAQLWTGGSFVLDGSPCVTFARRNWFEAYRAGLERWCGEAGARVAAGPAGSQGVDHDQNLLQRLAERGEIEQDADCARASPRAAGLCISANPLAIELGLPAGERTRLVFERVGREDRLAGRVIPFWHMQTGFARYLAHSIIVSELLPGRHRIPTARFATGDGALASDALRLIQKMLVKGQAPGRNPGRYQERLMRGALYREFFETDLPWRIFDDAVWWKLGVFAARRDA